MKTVLASNGYFVNFMHTAQDLVNGGFCDIYNLKLPTAGVPQGRHQGTRPIEELDLTICENGPPRARFSTGGQGMVTEGHIVAFQDFKEAEHAEYLRWSKMYGFASREHATVPVATAVNGFSTESLAKK